MWRLRTVRGTGNKLGCSAYDVTVACDFCSRATDQARFQAVRPMRATQLQAKVDVMLYSRISTQPTDCHACVIPLQFWHMGTTTVWTGGGLVC